MRERKVFFVRKQVSWKETSEDWSSAMCSFLEQESSLTVGRDLRVCGAVLKKVVVYHLALLQ